MKKILLGALALLSIAAFSSCGKCGDKCGSANDSLSTAYGDYVGLMIGSDFSQFDNHEKADKQALIKGMQLVFGAEDSENSLMGMQIAVQMIRELDQFEKQGLDVNKKEVFAAFKKAFMADSINMIEISKATEQFRMLYEAAQAKAQDKANAEKAQSPEAVQSKMSAEAAIADLTANNPDAKTTESGLVYVIEEAGTAPTPDANATVVVNYTGKHLNGEIFDSSEGRGSATFNLQGVVPGFREGLMLLGKGGKATLYIPGELAYGVNGMPQAGIAPNEMLVFDVELLDIQQ